MPRLVAFRPAGIAGVDLGHVAYQLTFGATKVSDDEFCFSLVYRYPQAQSGTFRPQDGYYYNPGPQTQALVQVPISLAESLEEVERACEAARGGGASETASIQRVSEAFELFKNRSGRVSNETVQRCVEDAAEVIRALWRLRSWLAAGADKKEEIEVKTSYAQRENQQLVTTILCLP